MLKFQSLQFSCSDPLQVNLNTSWYASAISFVLSASDMLILETSITSILFWCGPTGTVNWLIEWMRLLALWVLLGSHLSIQSWLQQTFGPPMSVCFSLMNNHLLGRILLLGFIMIAQLTCYGLGNVPANLMVLMLNSWEELLIHLASRCIHGVPRLWPWYVWLCCYFSLIIKLLFMWFIYYFVQSCFCFDCQNYFCICLTLLFEGPWSCWQYMMHFWHKICSY